MQKRLTNLQPSFSMMPHDRKERAQMIRIRSMVDNTQSLRGRTPAS